MCVHCDVRCGWRSLHPTYEKTSIRSSVHVIVKRCTVESPSVSRDKLWPLVVFEESDTFAASKQFQGALKKKKKVGVIRSLNVALVPDWCVGCIEVYGRIMEKHTETQHIHSVWPLMKKYLPENSSECKLTADIFFPKWLTQSGQISLMGLKEPFPNGIEERFQYSRHRSPAPKQDQVM